MITVKEIESLGWSVYYKSSDINSNIYYYKLNSFLLSFLYNGESLSNFKIYSNAITRIDEDPRYFSKNAVMQLIAEFNEKNLDKSHLINIMIEFNINTILTRDYKINQLFK